MSSGEWCNRLLRISTCHLIFGLLPIPTSSSAFVPILWTRKTSFAKLYLVFLLWEIIAGKSNLQLFGWFLKTTVFSRSLVLLLATMQLQMMYFVGWSTSILTSKEWSGTPLFAMSVVSATLSTLQLMHFCSRISMRIGRQKRKRRLPQPSVLFRSYTILLCISVGLPGERRSSKTLLEDLFLSTIALDGP